MSIKSMRKAAGMTQEQLAKTLGVHQTAVAWWETGRAQPATGRLLALAEALGCTVDELLKEDGGDPADELAN